MPPVKRPTGHTAPVRGRPARRYRRLACLVSAGFLAVSGLPGHPAAAGISALGPRVEVPQLAAPAPPPAPVPESDRQPIAAPPSAPEVGIGNPDEILPTAPENLSAESPHGLKLRPTLGGPNYDVFALPGAGTHAAVLHVEDVNVKDAAGSWVRPGTQLVSDAGGGWSAQLDGVGISFPGAQKPGSPVLIDVGGHQIGTSLVGAQEANGHPAADGLIYEAVLPSTDAEVTLTPHGYKEDLLLRGPEAPTAFSYDIDAGSLSLVPAEDGSFAFSDKEEPVAFILPPVAYDSSAEVVSSDPKTVLTDLGEGRYRLDIHMDETFLAGATFPVTLDPGLTILLPQRDTYVNSSSPNSSYEANTRLDVQSSRRTFIRFDVSGLIAGGRLVYDATLKLRQDGSYSETEPVLAKRPTATWPTPLTWNNQPPVDPLVHATASTVVNYWLDFQLKSLYQGYLDGTWGELGVRLEQGQDDRSFYSSEAPSGYRPTLTLSWNDLPPAPSLLSPGPEAELQTQSPTLALAQGVVDPNGDPVLYSYQVSDSATDFTGSHLVWESGWTDQGRFTVPPGKLWDGQYWWRVQARDVCAPPAGLCSLTDGAGVVRAVPTSAAQRFTLSLHHLGNDSRYGAWSQELGNDMALGVNQGNGNLVLDVPLDTLGTPGGDLALSLTYNHQQTDDLGLGGGWGLAAGPFRSGEGLPLGLAEPAGGGIPPGEAVVVRFRDGREGWFTKRAEGVFRSSGQGAGTVHQNADGTYTLTAAGGDVFTFSSGGILLQAQPQASKPGTAVPFRYTFDGSGHLTRVEDAIGRTVEITWAGGALQAITAWDGRAWEFAYSNGRLAGVTDPAGGTASFTYDGSGHLSEVRDGQQTADQVSGWRIDYAAAPGDGSGLLRVDKVHPPVPAGAVWEFDYAGPFQGTVAAQTTVTDPRGVATPTIPGDFQTVTDFSKFGLPVRVAGPADQHGFWPITTQVWDSNGNPVCARNPAANAVGDDCTATQGMADPLTAEYAYEADPPYPITEITEPAPDSAGVEPPATESIAYDEGQQGLWARMYENPDLAGLPEDEGMWTAFDNQWGQGSPPGVGPDDGWSVRWTGFLQITGTQTTSYAFRATSEDGFQMSIDDATVLDCPGATGCQDEGTKLLAPGLHPVTVEFSEDTGDAFFKLEWDPGGGWAVMGSNQFRPNLDLVTTEATDVLDVAADYPGDAALAQGLPASEVTTDPVAQSSRETQYTYDGYGRPLTVTTAAGTPQAATTTNTYTDDVQAGTSCVTRTVDATGAVTEFECNGAGEVTRETRHVRAVASQLAQSRVTVTTYDAAGRVIRVDGSEGGRTETTYDLAGRPIRTEELISQGGTQIQPGTDPIQINSLTSGSSHSDFITETWGGTGTIGTSWGIAQGADHDWTLVNVRLDPSETIVDGKGQVVGASSVAQGLAHLAGVAAPDVDATVEFEVDAGNSDAVGARIVARRTADDTFYNLGFTKRNTAIETGGLANASALVIAKKVSGTTTILAEVPFQPTTGVAYKLRAVVLGTGLRVKVWDAALAEPSAWNLEATDSSIAGPGSVGLLYNAKNWDTLLVNDFKAGTSFTYQTASISPPASQLILAAVESKADGGGPTPTLSGNGLVWEQVGSGVNTWSGLRVTIFRAVGQAPSSGPVTIGFGGAQQAAVWGIYAVPEAATGNNGADALVQWGTAESGSSIPESLTVTLASFADPANGAFAAFGPNQSGHTEDSGWTELHDLGVGVDNAYLQTQWRPDPDVTAVSTSVGGQRWVGVAVEIARESTTVVTEDVVAVTTNEYDGAGRLLAETLPDPDGTGPLASPVIHHAYDAVGNEIQMTDARGKVWQTGFDAADRVIAETTPTGLVTATDYELVSSGSYVNRVTVTDPFGVDTVTTNNILGRPISERVGTFQPTTYEYDVVGNVIRTTDPAGVWTEQEYNGFGEVTTERTPYGDTVAPYSESWLGKDLLTPTNPTGLTSGEISGNDLLLQNANEAGGTPPSGGSAWPVGRHRVSFSLQPNQDADFTLRVRNLTAGTDAASQVVTNHPGGSQVLTLEFDSAAGKSYQAQVVHNGPEDEEVLVYSITHELTGAATATMNHDYDAGGNLVETDGPRTDVNDSLAYEYDLARRLTKATQSGIGTPNATQYDYDDTGDLVKVTDPEDRVRRWTFDQAGREKTYIDALGTTTSHYNATGWLTRQDDPRGLTLRLEYDRLGRQIRRWAEVGSQEQDAESFGFDAAGNMVSAAVEATGLQTTLTYDDDGRLVGVGQGRDQTTYVYGPATPGKLTSMTDPTGGTTTYAYNQNGLLQTLTDPLTLQNTTYWYDTGGRVSSRADPAGLTWRRTYDRSGSVADQIISGPAGEVASFALTYDPAGDVIQKVQNVAGAPAGENGTWTYQYDGANRLASATNPGGVGTGYAYDGAGNRVSIKVGSEPAVITTYNGAGLPVSSSDGMTYAHDEAGSLTGETGPGPDWVYGYDAWGRMTSAQGGSTISYIYDSLSRLTERVSGSTTTTYSYTGETEDPASVTEGGTETTYAHSPSGPLAQKSGGNVRFLIPDLHEDIVGLTDLSGLVVGTLAYSPWGEPRAMSGEGTPFRFQGDLTDPTTGLVDMGTRLYDPGLGRFTSRDVLFGESQRPTSLNQYVYGWDNPVSLTDPDGMNPKKSPAYKQTSQAKNPNSAKSTKGRALRPAESGASGQNGSVWYWRLWAQGTAYKTLKGPIKADRSWKVQVQPAYLTPATFAFKVEPAHFACECRKVLGGGPGVWTRFVYHAVFGADYWATLTVAMTLPPGSPAQPYFYWKVHVWARK